VTLAESSKPGNYSRIVIDLHVAGELLVNQEGQTQRIKIEARGALEFDERTLTLEASLPASSARFYHKATMSMSLAGERFEHSLAADRKLVVARRNTSGLFCYSPAGSFTRDELDLVTEHFNPQCLPGLLPGKDVNLNDAWPIPNAAAQAACQFDGLVKNGLAGKLVEVKNGFAVFTIEGPAEGIENGAKVSLTVNAIGKFDVAAKRIVELIWKQKDDREQGPVSPASRVDATIGLRRTVPAAEPAELSAAALAGVKDEVPAALTQLRYVDPKDRFRLDYPRDWHITGQTDSHVIFRLLDRGELIAQATITNWKTLQPGAHLAPDEFKKAVANSPSWVVTKVVEDGEVPIDAGRWIYRLTAEGKLDEQPIVQRFHVLAGPKGEHVVVTCSMKPEAAKAVGARDVELVKAIEFKK
jgi:hypothetical protein